MIPYFEWTTVQLGPVTIYVWGLFVATGAVIGVLLARRAARRAGLSPDAVADLAVWLVIAGLIGGRIGHAAFYDPAPFLRDPFEILRVWHGGLSSIGGFLAASVAFAVFVRRRRIDAIAFADVLIQGFPLGWAVGRIGCFVTHLHPGRLASGPLTVRYPDGSRWDLGLIESLTGLAVAAVLLVVLRRFPRRGAAIAAVAWSYLPIRFLSDFLRASDLPGSDLRVAGLLTPAQIGVLALLLFSFLWLPRVLGAGRGARPTA